LKIEVLPAPLGPMMVKISPFSMLKLTLSTALRPPKCSEMPSTVKKLIGCAPTSRRSSAA
jgi:hypothetical protein